MHCNGCDSDQAAHTKTGCKPDGTLWEICDICSNVAPVWLPDMYLGTSGGIQTDENLCGDDGNPIPFQTKREKAIIVKQLGLRQSESAERQHGMRNESHLHRKKYFI